MKAAILLVALVVLAMSSTLAQSAMIDIADVTASSEIGGNFDRLDDYLIDGSGLTDGAHTNSVEGTMWLSTGTDFGGEDTDPSVTFDLGEVYLVDRIHVWNYNEVNLPARGVNAVSIEYGITPALGSTLAGITNFTQAPGEEGYTGEVFDSFTPFEARYIKFDINSHHGGDNEFYGLSEVQFFGGTPPPEPQEIVMNFDCGREGWYPNGTSALTDQVGGVSFVATGGDPFMVVDQAVDGTAMGEVGFQVNVAGSPSDSFTAAFFWFADGGHGRVPYTLTGDGDYTVRLNPGAQQESGTGAWDASVYRMRLDFPDGDATAFVNAETVFTLDWFAVTADPEYVGIGNEAAADCDGDGLSSGFEVALGTNPFVADTDGDGVDDGTEVYNGSDPLDENSKVTVPATHAMGLMILALALGSLGILMRRRATN